MKSRLTTSCCKTKYRLDGQCVSQVWNTIFIILILSSNPLLSQESLFSEDWRWSHFTTESGLPSNNILQIIETDDSTIWVNTTEGFAWFDGFEFNRAVLTKGFNERIIKIKPTVNNKILVFNSRNSFIGNVRGFSDFLNNPPTNTFEYYDHDQYLFYYGDSIKLYNTQTISLPEHLPKNTQGTAKGFWKTKSGAFWINNNTGIYKLKNQKWELIISANEQVLNVKTIVENEKGNGVFLALNPPEYEGIWEWKSNGKPELKMRKHAAFILSVDIGRNDEIITIGKNGEVLIHENNIWKTYINPFSQIKNPSVAFFSMNGNLWIGGENGLFVYKNQKSAWTFYSHDPSDKRNSVNDILLSSDNSIWLATADGLEVLHQNGFNEWITTIQGKPLGGITCIEQDREGNIWIGSGSTFYGTYKWDGKEWKHYTIGDSPKDVYVHKITKDQHKNLWFLCLSRIFSYSGIQPGTFLLQEEKFLPWTDVHIKPNLRVYS
ncbi:MAG: hypothetical protein HYZ34_12695, partial [Ignavibacteriae bacterium]|nr:hypothetical protein [Ignavibacteriota bacterium]